MPATPGRCLHYTNGRTWKCKRCKALDRNRGILGGGRCAHNKLLAGCTLCSTGAQHEKCVHGMLSRRCTQGCARGTSICPCGKRATECSSCAREGVLCPHLRRWRSCNNKSCSRRGILQGNIVKLDYVQANLVDKDCEFKPAGSLCRWAFPKRGAPTLLMCSISDYPKTQRPGQGCYPPHPCTHWAFGIVLSCTSRLDIFQTQNMICFTNGGRGEITSCQCACRQSRGLRQNTPGVMCTASASVCCSRRLWLCASQKEITAMAG